MASEKNKKYAIISVSSLVLVAVVVALIASIGFDDGNSKEVSASQRSIKNVCQSTDYQQTCVESLSSAAGNATEPKDLIKVAFDVTIKRVKEAVNRSLTLQELHKDPRTNRALKNCEELANLAINDLQRSFHKMEELELMQFDDILTKLKIWLSGAITYEETCLDGFKDTEGDAGDKMRGALKTAMELTANSLAMVDEISIALESLNIQNTVTNRRLLSSSDCPSWLCVELWVRKLKNDTRRILSGDKPTEIKANLTVAKDGTGNYTTINEALFHIPKKSNNTFVLYIKEGIYNEHVQFNSSLTHLMVVGDGPTKTRITGRLNYIDGTPTYHTATVAVQGDYFIAKDIGFENTAGPEKHQAVALRVGADMSIFYNCHMDGYQDTLYAHTYRQFYRDCVISGTIDFIFGDAAAVFQNCTMVVRKPMDNQQCIVTAQGRKNLRQPTGLVLQNCTVEADPALYPTRNKTKSYLGRPWKEYSRTIIMESYIGDLIQPQGWLPWNESFALDTLFYSEFNNRGPSSSKEKRVKWKGIKELPTERVIRFTAAEFIEGGQWVAETGVPYIPGLLYPPPKENATAISEYTPEEDLDLIGYKHNETSHDKAKPTLVASNSNAASTTKGSPGTSNDVSSTTKGSSGTSNDASSTTNESPGTSNDASSTTKGSPGTSNDASSTTKGSPGTSNDASSTTKGSPGTSNDASSTTKGSFGTSNDASSTTNGSPETSNDASSTTNGSPGTSNYASSTTKGSSGTGSNDASSTTNGSPGTSNDASSTTKESPGTSDDASSTTNGAPGTNNDVAASTTNGAPGTSNTAGTTTKAAPESSIAASPADAPALSPDGSPSEPERSWFSTFSVEGIWNFNR